MDPFGIGGAVGEFGMLVVTPPPTPIPDDADGDVDFADMLQV